MTIASLDAYIASIKEIETMMRSVGVTVTSFIPFTIFDQLGQPGPGALNIGNTANGIVPVDTDNGYPLIASFGGAAGYISGIDFGTNVACRITLFDRLFACGAYAFNTDTTLAAQPSYAGRLPDTNYNGLQLWIEHVTAFTGTPSFQINYLDQGGAAGDTGVFSEAPTSLLIRRALQLPLAAGDSGVSQITRVRCTVATVGTFNVMVLRPLWMGRVPISTSGGDVHDLLRTGLPQIFDTSALFILVTPDSASSGLPILQIEIAH